MHGATIKKKDRDILWL